MTSITKQLREVGELLGLDCGDNGCLFAREKSGARTNGGCQCDLVDAVMQVKDTAMHAEAYGDDCEKLEAEVKLLREMNDAMEKHGSWLDKELRKIVVSLSRARVLPGDVKHVLDVIRNELSKLLVLDTEPLRGEKAP